MFSSMNHDDDPLRTAINKGDAETVKSLLSERTTARTFGHGRNCPYTELAAKLGKPDILETLLHEAGSSGGCDLTTPLLKAVVGRTLEHAKCVDLLLGQGASLDSQSQSIWGQTPLNFASQSGDMRAVEALLLRGARLEGVCKGGNTALLRAAEHGKADVLNHLLQSGANVNHQNTQGMTALMLACRGSHVKCVSSLLQTGKADMNLSSNFNTTTALIEAVNSNDLIRTLLKHGAKVNQKNCQSKTALLVAASNQHINVNCIESLLENGADANIRPSNAYEGLTPLISAVINKRCDVMGRLLTHGADVNKPSTTGRTALMHACNCRTPSSDLIRELLKMPGIQLECRDFDGRTALHHSLQKWPMSISTRMAEVKDEAGLPTRLLIECGANVNSATPSGTTPLVSAIFEKNSEGVRLLVQAGADPYSSTTVFGGTPMCLAVRMRNSDTIVRTLLELGVSLDYELHLAIHLRKNELVYAMLEHGAMPSLARLELVMVSQCPFELMYGVSPFFVSLLKGDALLSNVFIGLRFLHQVDLFKVPSCKELHDFLRNQDKPETLAVLSQVKSTVWPLSTLAFVAVSTAVGFGSGREEKLAKSGLPVPLQQQLMFRAWVTEWESERSKDSVDPADHLRERFERTLQMDAAGDSAEFLTMLSALEI